MQFNSIDFLFFFLPLFLAAYYLLPKSWRSGLLVAGSLLFYYFGSNEPWLTLWVLIGTTAFTYLMGVCMERLNKVQVLSFSLAVLAAILIFFKLYDGGSMLPVGMSFYLFQLAAYIIAVYRDQVRQERDLFRFGAQTMMFPKLLMGPLMDPKDLQDQVKKPVFSTENFHRGLQELILGLALKVLLANRIGGLWGQAGTIGYEYISTPFAWLALIAFAAQLYLDFWGYSLMAMGLGRMLGFTLPENFIDPYASKSVSEFWRRWHASLGAWFRDNLYIPLGGNRKGTLRTILNLLVVWIFTGVWHGVGGNYLLWAMMLFFFIVMERLWLRKLLDRSRVLCHVYTVVVILLSWIPFAIGDWDKMLIFTSKIFGLGGAGLDPTDYITWGGKFLWLLVGGVVCATPLPRMIWNKVKDHWLTDIVLFILFWITVYFVATSAQDPFLYFQY